MKRVGWPAVLILVVAALPAGTARAEDRALLVGVGTHERQSPFRDLPGIGRDVEIMRKVARTLGFEEGQIRVLLDEEATWDGIASAFDRWLIDAVGPEDRALFYFSGHGYQRADRDGDEPDGRDELLVPHDYAGTSEALTNVLVDDQLEEWIDRLRTNDLIVFLDACHSGSALRSPSGGQAAWSLFDGESPKSSSRRDAGGGAAGYVALSAARDWQQAQATADGSTFTVGIGRAVLDQAASGAPLTMKRILDVAAAEIARKHPSELFHPVLSGDVARADEELRRGPSARSPWDRLASFAAGAPEVEVGGVRPTYRAGDLMTLDVVMPMEGHLSVLTVVEGADHATVLFPNPWSGATRFARGERVRIPDREFDLVMEVEDSARWQGERNLLVVAVAAVPHDFDRNGGELPLARLVQAMNSRSVGGSWTVVPYVVER